MERGSSIFVGVQIQGEALFRLEILEIRAHRTLERNRKFRKKLNDCVGSCVKDLPESLALIVITHMKTRWEAQASGA